METIISLLIAASTAYGIPNSVAVEIAKQESSLNPSATRFEPHLKFKYPGYSHRFLNSSHGLMQVLGIHFAERQISPSEAYHLETNIEVAMHLLAKHRAKCEPLEETRLIYCILKRYNGGHSYAEKITKRIYK